MAPARAAASPDIDPSSMLYPPPPAGNGGGGGGAVPVGGGGGGGGGGGPPDDVGIPVATEGWPGGRAGPETKNCHSGTGIYCLVCFLYWQLLGPIIAVKMKAIRDSF